jgi:small subunit ribosomal protein S23
VNLHQHHDLSISKAYASAIAQFRALRAEQEVANATAALEAEAYGGSFGQTEIERNFEREGKALQTWTRGASHLDEGEVAARKRWKAIVERAPNTAGPWSRGAGYTRLWRDGVRPDYAALTQPVSTPPPEPEPSTPAPAQARLSLMESVRRR